MTPQQKNIIRRVQEWFLQADEGESRYFSKRKILLILLLVLYTASPLDLFPEALLGPLGITDDTIIFLMGLYTIFMPNIPNKLK